MQKWFLFTALQRAFGRAEVIVVENKEISLLNLFYSFH